MNNKYKCVLFDMDGVVLDTESQYSEFWQTMGEKYEANVPDMYTAVTGLSDEVILNRFFPHLSQVDLENVYNDISAFEEKMLYPEMEGAISFIIELKNKGFKIGLVTSSEDRKLEVINKDKSFDILFDMIVTADKVTNRKPHPEPYLMAAENLEVKPSECIVFEDSFTGIEAATSAGMKVVGYASTQPAKALMDRCSLVISDFCEIRIDDLLNA